MNEKYVKEAQAILDASGGRPLTRTEIAQVEELIEKANAEKLRANVERLGASVFGDDQPIGGGPSKGARPGDVFVASAGYRGLLENGIPAGAWSTGPVDYMAAAGDPILKSTGSNADVVPRQVVPGLFDPGLRQERLTLADLFGQDTASGGTIQWMKATTRNAPADAATTEGQDKPGAEFAFDDQTTTLTKLAAFIPISEEMFEDAPAVRTYVNTHLPLMVEQSLEAKLATALYAGAGLTAAPAALTGGSNGFDAIAAGIHQVQTNDYFEPDGLFIHPDDWWALRIDKDSDENYYGSGPWAGPSANPWGLRTVVSTSATQGSPVVGAFRDGATLWRRGPTRLEASNSHSDYFVKNKIAIRAELRYALTIYFADAFAVVDVTGS